ncbi:MAG: adenosylmethionine decarboxylase [Candidatus Anammoxibacter sp.]
MGNIGTVGRHFIVEMWGCDTKMINDPERVMDILHRAASDARATVIKSIFHRFSPTGVTGVAILAESHISIHTWPDEGYVAADIFTCGTNTDPALGVQSLIDGFKPENSSSREFQRGNAQSKEITPVN